MLIVLVLLASASFIFYRATTIEPTPDLDEVRKKIEGRHPKRMSPEKTLETYLNAFIARDIDTVMAYYQGSSEWQEKMKQNWQDLMTEKKHIKRIVNVRLIKTWRENGRRTAELSGEFVATWFFKGSNILSSLLGNHSIKRKWKFYQARKNGPWYYNEGGF